MAKLEFFIIEAIKEAIKSEISHLVCNAIREAQSDLEKKIPEIVSSVALKVVGEVDFSSDRQYVTIRVRYNKDQADV